MGTIVGPQLLWTVNIRPRKPSPINVGTTTKCPGLLWAPEAHTKKNPPPGPSPKPTHFSLSLDCPSLPLRPPTIHRKSPSKGGLEMGQVSILRCGVSLPEVMMCGFRTPKNPSRASATAAADDLLFFGMGRLGPEPASLPIFQLYPYAGSACNNSPAPSDVPLPSFKKKTASRIVDDSATRDLRRFLGLD